MIDERDVPLPPSPSGDVGMLNTVIVLGVDDPEMREIAKICAASECRKTTTIRATYGGRPVHPGYAYHADAIPVLMPDGWRGPRHSMKVQRVVFIECNAPTPEGVDIIRIDHHREGDPGWGLPPAEFWAASSIGQFLALLDRRFFIASDDYDADYSMRYAPRKQDLLALAAMDHCFPAALRGECPGVAPGDVLKEKTKHMAEILKIRPDEVAKAIEIEEAAIKAAPKWIDDKSVDLTGRYCGEGYNLSLLAAQVAAAKTGVSVVLRHRDRVGEPEKISLSGAASPELVEQWMNIAATSGLTNIYGSPARGYAGGYRTIQ